MTQQTYAVKMQKGSKTWTSYTQANSKFDAMLQMNKKYGCGAVALSAELSKECKWSTDV